MIEEQFPLIKRISRFLPILSLFAFILIVVANISVISFLAAITPEEALKKGLDPLPAGWEAGVPNHGSYYQWLSIAEHPILFGLSVLIWLSPLFIAVYVSLTPFGREKIRQFIFRLKNNQLP